jgi:N-acyl-D-amino-acid deacylase
MYDLILRNGRVVDGSGAPWYRADLAIAGERIVAIGRRLDGPAARELDCAGLIVTPGFIDLHSHSDVTLLVNPRAESAVRQGITTQVVGQCGFSAGPVRWESRDAFRQDSFIFAYDGYEWTWRDIAGYRQALAAAQPAINVATLVGHGALRQFIMGAAARRPTPDELAGMQRALDDALEQGARGLSSGLTYAPGRFAETDELAALGKVVRRHGGVYHSHMRDYTRFLLDSINETIAVGEAAGIPVNISHMYPGSPQFWGELAHRATETVDAARRRGVEATFDITPWTRGGGPYMQMLPSWAQDGGFSALKLRLQDPATRRRIAHELEHGAPDWKGWLPIAWDDQLIAKVGRPANQSWCGRTIADIAAERGLPPAETALLLLLEDDGQYWTAPTIKSQDDINHILSHPLGVPITDGMALAPYGPLHQPTMPRSYGTFPRVLGRYVREWGVLRLETAVQKLTSMPAMRVGLADRGILRQGLYADITVFNPDTVLDRETYQDPHAFPAGIEHVIINGRLVVEAGVQSDARPGKVL